MTACLVASLEVRNEPLWLTMRFVDTEVIPGDTATLEFTLHNRDRVETYTNISFTDPLGFSPSGLIVATGLPASDVCGAGSQLSGTGTLTSRTSTFGRLLEEFL